LTIGFFSSKIIFAILTDIFIINRDVAQFGTAVATVVQTATEFSEAIGCLQSAGAHDKYLKSA